MSALTPEIGSTIMSSHIYPVGSIYECVGDTNPQTLFGGTWERLYYDYDYIYVCSQVIHPEYTLTVSAGTSLKQALCGSYTNLFNGLYNKDLPCPPNYTTKLRWSMEYTTQGNTQVGLAVNNVLVISKQSTWSNTQYRRTNYGGLFQLGVDILPVANAIYSTEGYMQFLDITNGNSYDAVFTVWDITKHVYFVSDKKIAKWKRTA